MENKRVAFILRDIEQYFGFLQKKGYKIDSAEYSSHLNQSWAVKLESPSCIIYITNDRGYIYLEFSSIKDENFPNKRISIEEIIFLLSKGKNSIEPFKGNTFWGKKRQFERLVNLLKEYIDQITLYFENYTEEQEKG